MNPGGLEQLVLMAILRLGPNAYGVSIHDEIESRAEHSLAISAVYITLDRMLKKGYVSSWLADKTEERGGRAKRYFKIEALGESALRASMITTEKMTRGWTPQPD